MRKTIHIGKPYITEENGRAYLKAPIRISPDTAHAYMQKILSQRKYYVWLTGEDYPLAAWGKDGTLWFCVPAGYGKYLCKERSNAFVVALFWYAGVSGSDIEFEASLSKRLYDGMTAMLLPSLAKSGFQKVSVKVSTEPAQSREGITTKPCQTRDFSGRKEYRTDS